MKQELQEIQDQLTSIKHNVEDSINPCRECSLVITKIDEAILWLDNVLVEKE